MAELPVAPFQPANQNSTEPQFIPSHFRGGGNGVSNVGMFQSNNQNFMQTLVPCNLPLPAGQQIGFSTADASNSNSHGPNLHSHLEYPPWFSNWNNSSVHSYYPGVHRPGVFPPDGPVTVVPFNRSVPPPFPRITFRPPPQQCIPSQMPLAGAPIDGDCDASGLLEVNDRKWIDSWLHRHPPRQLSSHNPPEICSKRKIKIWEVKQSLQSCMSLLGELEDLEREVRTGLETLTESEWQQKWTEVNVKKDALKSALGVFDEEALLQMRSLLLKRGRKRGRQRSMRALSKEVATAQVEKKRRLHLEVDIWLESKQAEVDLHKREEVLKQEADAVLWGVRRKQCEGRRILSLLPALVKLHHVRMRKTDPTSNPALCENEDQFQIIIDKLSSLWERQMSEYEAEEKALRVMLRESPEVDTFPAGVGITKGRTKATGELQRSLRLWESLLFGSGSTSQELAHLGVESCQWQYLHPSRSLDALIETRKQWDQFISYSRPASSIPSGWVIPADASSEQWKAHIGPLGDRG